MIPQKVVKAAHKRGPGALAAICEKTYARIYRYLSYKMDNVRDTEDLSEEVFVRMLGSISEQKGNFEAWVFQIARNVLTDQGLLQSIAVEFPFHNSLGANSPATSLGNFNLARSHGTFPIREP